MIEKKEFTRPIIAAPELEKPISDKILNFIYWSIFSPIIEQIKATKKIYFNSENDLIDAIIAGKIQYSDGKFQGKFTASISKELKKLGGKYSRISDGFNLQGNQLPINIQIAIGQANANYDTLHREIISTIDKIDIEEPLKQLSFYENYFRTIKNVDGQYNKTVSVPVDLTPERKAVIASEYSDNLKLYIKNFTDAEILELRKLTEENAFKGFRMENLQKIIIDRYKVSESKAKFLARQETNLLTTKYKEVRYKSAGITQYKWSTSGKSNVRHDHKLLNGKIFNFDDPPIVDLATGRRANPGEDYNCYCTAVPVVN